MRIRYSGSATGVLALDGMDEVSVGRAKDCHIRSDDSAVSRKHALLRRAGDRWVIADLGSSHGILLAGRKVSRHVLCEGDVLALGTLVLTIEESSPALAIEVTDPQIAASASAAITIGKSFAFIGRDLLDDLARAQADDGQHLARARDRPLRNAVLFHGRERRAARQAGCGRCCARASDEVAARRGVLRHREPSKPNQCVIAWTMKFVPMRKASAAGASG